jgi:hypothetical protein
MGFALLAVGLFGADEALVEAAFPVMSFASYLVPLGVYELYRRARRSPAPARQGAMAAGLLALTLVMATGIFGATMMMWLPPLKASLSASGLFG